MSDTNLSERYLQAAADSERAILGLAPLKRDPALVAAARAHVIQMVAHDSISHQFADEPELAARGAAAGARFSRISENVAESSSAIKIHAAWMRSEGHRHNLLDPNVDSVGIVVVTRGNRLFAVEDVERSLAAMTMAQQERTVAAAIAPARIKVVEGNLYARKTCKDARGATVNPRPAFVMRYTTADLGELPSQLNARLVTGRYATALVAACPAGKSGDFSMYRIAVLLY